MAKIDEWRDTEHQGEWSSLLKKKGKRRAWSESPKKQMPEKSSWYLTDPAEQQFDGTETCKNGT